MSSDFLPCWPHSPADHILCYFTYILPHQSPHPGVLSPQNLSLTAPPGPLLYPLLSPEGSCPYLTSAQLLEPCLSAWKYPVLSLSGYPTPPFSTGDSTDHNAVRPVVAKYLGESRAGAPKHFSGIQALCPLCLHLHCGRWAAGVSG